MSLLFYPLGYLKLRDEKMRAMGRRDAPATAALTIVIALPFVLLPDANFMGSGGFLSNMMNLCSALAGFYVAALVAAATLSRGSDLDDKIQIGQVRRIISKEGAFEKLSRREFVCSIFGYLSFLSLGLAILSNFLVVIGGSTRLGNLLRFDIESYNISTLDIISPLIKSTIAIPYAHLIVVTSYGLYYLIKRLYEKKPQVVAKGGREDKAA
jgi:hypothetical protein